MVTLTVKRSGDNRYWNGSVRHGQTQWSSTSSINLTATGTSNLVPAADDGEPDQRRHLHDHCDGEGLRQPHVDCHAHLHLPDRGTARRVDRAGIGCERQGSVTVSGTATATSPATVASVEFQYKSSSDSTWTSVAIDTATPYAAPWVTTGLSDGSYDLREIVTDSAGNTTTSSTRTVTVDNNPPTGSITVPANGVYVRGSSVTVSADSADSGSGVANATFQYKPTSGGTWTQIGSPDTSSLYR